MLRIAFGFTALALIASAHAQTARVAAQFHDVPEGLTANGEDLYTVLHNTNEVYRIRRGEDPEKIADLDDATNGARGYGIGIEHDGDRTLYVAYTGHSAVVDGLFSNDPIHPECHDPTVLSTGVYKVDTRSGQVEAVATRRDGHPFCLPDDIAIGADGALYITDLIHPGIWRMNPDGSEVEMWSEHPLLSWNDRPNSGFYFGVNVILFAPDENALYVGTSGDPLVVRIPIAEDGSAGEATVVSYGHTPLDGIERMPDGTLYVSEVFINEIVMVHPTEDRLRRVIADRWRAPLDSNTSLAFWGDELCTANLGYPKAAEDADRTIVCISDLPGWD